MRRARRIAREAIMWPAAVVLMVLQWFAVMLAGAVVAIAVGWLIGTVMHWLAT